MPPSFRFPLSGVGGEPAELVVPYKYTPALEQLRGNAYSTFLIARLAPDVTLAAARPRFVPETRISPTNPRISHAPMSMAAAARTQRSLLVSTNSAHPVCIIAQRRRPLEVGGNFGLRAFTGAE